MHGYIINRKAEFVISKPELIHKWGIVSALLFSLLLAGCGQRGGLYLPPKNPPAAANTQAAAP